MAIIRGTNPGFKVDLDLTGIRKIDKRFPIAVRKATREAAELVLNDVKNNAPIGRRPPHRYTSPHYAEFGPLHESYRIEYEEQGRIGRARGMVAHIGSDSPVALWTEFGTKAHGPVEEPVLRFEIDGQLIETKWVEGMEANPILTNAYEDNLNEIKWIYETHLQDFLRHLRVTRAIREAEAEEGPTIIG